MNLLKDKQIIPPSDELMLTLEGARLAFCPSGEDIVLPSGLYLKVVGFVQLPQILPMVHGAGLIDATNGLMNGDIVEFTVAEIWYVLVETHDADDFLIALIDQGEKRPYVTPSLYTLDTDELKVVWHWETV